jgi:hypothetical protein
LRRIRVIRSLTDATAERLIALKGELTALTLKAQLILTLVGEVRQELPITGVTLLNRNPQRFLTCATVYLRTRDANPRAATNGEHRPQRYD